MNTLTSISGEIYDELDDPTDITSASILSWLQENIGKLNNALTTTYQVVGGDTDSPLGDIESSIYKMMYMVRYYNRQLMANLGAAAYDSAIIELTEGNRNVRKVSKNEIAKIWRMLKNDTQAELDAMIQSYQFSNSNPNVVVTNSDGYKGTDLQGAIFPPFTLYPASVWPL